MDKKAPRQNPAYIQYYPSDSRLSATDFKGQLSIQLKRPVYNSNYTTGLFNYIENNDFMFSYTEGQPLDFDINTFYSKKGVGSHVDRHESLGDGCIGQDFFVRFLHDSRFDDMPIILETPDPTRWSAEIAWLHSL